MVWVVVCGVDIIIILAVPGDIIEWVLHLADHFVGILVALGLAVSIACFLQLLDLNQVGHLLHLIFHFGEHIVVGAQANLHEVLLPGGTVVMVMVLVQLVGLDAVTVQ